MGTLLQTLVLALGLLGYPLASAGQVELPTDISVHLTAQPDVGLIPGEPIVFTLTVVNIGPQPANDLSVISSDFYDQIDLGSGSADCQGVILSVSRFISTILGTPRSSKARYWSASQGPAALR